MQQMKRKVTRIHTISFNCLDSAANDFLKKLAAHMGGRYHRCHGATDGHLVAHKMLTEGFSDEDNLSLPVFEGDDLKILSGEINKARRFLTQARSFRYVALCNVHLPVQQCKYQTHAIEGQRRKFSTEAVMWLHAIDVAHLMLLFIQRYSRLRSTSCISFPTELYFWKSK
uniref:Uncharacterized protein n=1 Tax=Callorhinchus milii TaxID=7868 RepID=A0A4W3I1I6_CALMI